MANLGGSDNKTITWPTVALAGLGITAVVALMLILPENDTRVAMVVSSLLGLLGGIYGTARAGDKITTAVESRLHAQNNRLTVLLADKEDQAEVRKRRTTKPKADA